MLILYYKLPLTYAIFCIQRHNLIAFFYVFFVFIILQVIYMNSKSTNQ